MSQNQSEGTMQQNTGAASENASAMGVMILAIQYDIEKKDVDKVFPLFPPTISPTFAYEIISKALTRIQQEQGTIWVKEQAVKENESKDAP